MPEMTPDMERLMRYAHNIGAEGNWLVNGEDADESLTALEEMGLVERNNRRDRWKLDDSQIEVEVSSEQNMTPHQRNMPRLRMENH